MLKPVEVVTYGELHITLSREWSANFPASIIWEAAVALYAAASDKLLVARRRRF